MNILSKTICKVISWNLLSLLNENKLDNVLHVFKDQNIQIACICETWFDTKNGKFTSAIKNAGFDIIHAHRDAKRGGGTAIIYKETLKIKQGEASTSKFLSFEYSYVYLLSYTKSKIILACIYRKQEVTCNTFFDEMETFLDRISDKCDILVLVGDFNVWVDIKENADSIKLINLMNGYGLSQLVIEPTHIGGHTLDHVYNNQFQMELKHEVIDDRLNISTDSV